MNGHKRTRDIARIGPHVILQRNPKQDLYSLILKCCKLGYCDDSRLGGEKNSSKYANGNNFNHECTEKKQIQTADSGSFVIILVHTTWDVWSAYTSMTNIFVELILLLIRVCPTMKLR